MSWERLPPISTYPKARRKELLRRIGNLLTGRGQQPLLNLDDVKEQLQSYQQSFIGLKTIPVDEIIGSVSRSQDFDDQFLPKTTRIEERWKAVENVFPDNAFPPISVYKVGGAYFVSDGHHRVAIAKQRNVSYIDAEVTEVHTPVEVTSDLDVAQLVHLGQQRIFMERSGLGAVVPGASFNFTRPEGYPELLDDVKIHGWDLLVQRGEYVSREEIAVHWYDRRYLPTIEMIEAAGLVELFGDVTVDDLFLWAGERWRHLFPQRGALSFEEIISETAEERADKLPAKAKRAIEKVDDKLDKMKGRSDAKDE